MIPVRPKTVSADATLIYPGQTFGPGFGIQQATLTAIQASADRMNANERLRFANAYRDWQANAAIDAYLGLPIPPMPTSNVITLAITYADDQGNVVTGPDSWNGLHNAWVDYKVGVLIAPIAPVTVPAQGAPPVPFRS